MVRPRRLPTGPAAPTSGPGPAISPRRARSVIMLMQAGGPSQIDLFDPKPELQRRHGQEYRGDVEVLQPGSETKKLMASPFRFRPHGECGMELSELIPWIGSVADDLCLVRSMYSDNNNHPQATRCLLSGKIFPGRPSVGSWISYALGTENQNLPAYVVLRDPDGYNNGGTTMWESGWLPAIFQGTEIQSRGAAVLDLHPSVPLPEGIQANNLRALARLNEERRKLYPHESELDARIRNYELAARMQLSAEGVLRIGGETAATRRLYGLDDPVTENFGTRCLMARRLVESGVRFVQVMVPVKSGGIPVGPPREDQAGPGGALPAGRPPDRGPDPGPEGPRAAGRRRSCSGRASSAACRSRRRATAATTIATPSAWCSPAAASRRATSTAGPTSSATRPSRAG